MSTKEIHKLLKKQLAQTVDEKVTCSDSASSLLNQVNDTYHSFDKDIQYLEKIIEKDSKELFKVNEALKQEINFSINRLEYIVKNINGVLFQIDKDGRFIYLSPAWEDLTGLSVKQSLNTKYSSFLVGSNNSEKKKIERFFNIRKKNKQIVLKFTNQNEEVKYIEVSITHRYNDAGENIGSIGTFTDVTKLKETQIKLKKANKAKDEFLAKMSHDMRTPLNSLIGLSNLLLMEPHLKEQEERLNALNFSAKHLLGIIDGILDYNKIESRNISFEKKEFSLNYLLEIFRRNFQFQAHEKNVDFQINKKGIIPNTVIGDSIRLSQIINNLLSNALKYTNQGKIGINISQVSSNKNKSIIRFQVFDTGIGIAKEEQRKIFKKFTQGSGSKTNLNSGAGLGLSICKELLKLQGSKLKVISDLGKGSIFQFDMEYAIKCSRTGNNKVETQDVDYSNLKTNILVVEDNKLNVFVLSNFLNKWGATFEVAENGLKAVKKVSKNHYDVVLMDLEMPVMNGYEATKKIRSMSNINKRETPIIALTASASKKVKSNAIDAGVDEFLTKPFNPEELYHILKQHEPVYFSKEIV